jgi:prevent-host-death family protein
METISTNDLRTQLGRRIDEAHFRGQHLVIEKNGEPRAVLVPYEWWTEHASAEDADA